jgi:UDP-glucose 4-epimerase
MKENHCTKLIFSSSACVYTSTSPPFDESSPKELGSITNAYGKTKLILEEIIHDVSKAYSFQCICLRYFNPVGLLPGHKKSCKQVSNLMDVILTGHPFTVFGEDYPTRDGTCIRDFIHIFDLAKGHLSALQKLRTETSSFFECINLGTGNGSTVLELVQTYERVHQKTLEYYFGEPRPGDLPVSVAKVEKADHMLGWKATCSLEQMCKDSLRN